MWSGIKSWLFMTAMCDDRFSCWYAKSIALYRFYFFNYRDHTMSNIPSCPQCTLENTYPDGANYVCADCGYEWPIVSAQEEDDTPVVKDANGNVLQDGDSVVLIKDLKVKGSSTVLKIGTKVKSIRLVGGDHGVDCKTDSGSFLLKAEFLKKV